MLKPSHFKKRDEINHPPLFLSLLPDATPSQTNPSAADGEIRPPPTFDAARSGKSPCTDDLLPTDCCCREDSTGDCSSPLCSSRHQPNSGQVSTSSGESWQCKPRPRDVHEVGDGGIAFSSSFCNVPIFRKKFKTFYLNKQPLLIKSHVIFFKTSFH